MSIEKEFSVLMSVYYKENPVFFELSLNSILNQSLKPSEIVLVQDGPLTEDLYKEIDRFKKTSSIKTKVVPLEKNLGLGKALNIGLINCSYDIVARMDTDDICFPYRFERQMNVLLDCHFDVVGSWILEFKENINQPSLMRKVPEKNNEIHKKQRSRNCLNHMTVLFRKDKVLSIGNYHDMPFFEDYYLWARMMKAEMSFYNIQEPLVYARIGNDMIGRRHGWVYLKKELRFYYMLLKIRFISPVLFISNLITRLPLRLLPKRLLQRIYIRLLRTEIK